MLVALSDIAAHQNQATEQTEKNITQFLDYCDTNPDSTIQYTKSDMKLRIHSDAGYLNASKA